MTIAPDPVSATDAPFSARPVDPWAWQDALGFSQGIDVRNPSRVVVLAGQGAIDPEGQVVEGDMAAQIDLAVDNIVTVLEQAGLTLADVVRLNIFTTDVPAFFEAYGTFAGRLAQAGCKPASTLLGVTALAIPGMAVELEATAVR